jgi:Peptidase family M1 domain/Secretion system C-terminal sorting domain
MNSQLFIGDGTLELQDTLSLGSLFGAIVYHKGSWVLHMLRGVLGDAVFFDALYNYANGDLKYTSVRTEDFIEVCEQVSGKNLQTFFEQWIKYPYFPRYVFSWSRDASAFGQSVRVQLNILQKQTTVVYEMPIELKFVFSDGSDTLLTVENFQRDQDYFFEFNEIPVEMLFDPDNWILKDVQDQSGGEFLSQIVIENIYPNPANTTVNIDVIFWGPSTLTLKIFDINGREINHLQPYLSSKTHRYYFRWNNDDRFGNPVAAGIYFIKPLNNDYTIKGIGKVIVLK